MRLLFSLIFLGISPHLSAQPAKRLNHLLYNVNEGLLHSQVTDINEDGNGFIWISTGSGVQRFDGKNFHRVIESTTDKGIPDDKYVNFFRLKNGNLLLVHSKGISEYNIHTNRFSRIAKGKDSLVGCLPVFEEPEAIWYFKNAAGAYRITRKELACTDSILIPVNEYLNRQWVYENNEGGISLFASGESIIYIAHAKQATPTIFRPTVEQKQFLNSAHYSGDTALVATQRGIEKIDLHSGRSLLITSYRTSEKLTRHLVNLHRISEQIYMVYEGKEIYELDLNSGKYINRLVDLQNNSFINLSLSTRFFSDNQNNLWVVTENEGIRKIIYQSAGFKYFGTPDKTKNFVKTIFVDKRENLVFCGSIGNGLLVFDTSQRLIKHLLSPSTVAAVIKTNSREYLLLMMGELKAFLFNTNNFQLRRVKIDSSKVRLNNVFDYHLNALQLNSNETLIQNSYGVYKVLTTRPLELKIETYQPIPIPTTTSYLDPDKTLWVGARANYFVINSDDLSPKQFRLKENILVRCFCRDKLERVWMGTEKGLYQLDKSGNVQKVYYKQDGLPDENIYAIREDRNGHLWFSHNRGISCMKADGSIVNFAKSDGLQENEFNTNTSFQAEDEELYFGGVNGISSFYPEKILRPTRPSKLLITSILVGDKEYESDSASWNLSRIDLPYHQNNLSFQFTAFGEQYNYRYRMSGLNETWINSNSENIARYVLPPGKYTFEVFAENTVTSKRIAVTIHPPFWNTTWFISLMAIAAISVVILVTRYLTRIKFKQRILELEQKRALDQERLRISREMHDDIGSGLTQIAMMSEAHQIDEIANTSRKLVSNISEIIWSLNPENNTLDQFLGYLREQLHKLLQYSGINYEIDFPENGHNILLNNAQRRNLLLITKEIVHNAVKHSKATQISISCRKEMDALKFVVKDNGCSFDPSIRSKGNGLHNIRRRITELSGNLSIDSGSGTTFSYDISLN